MTIKQKIILTASRRLLTTDLTCWNVVDKILSDLYEEARTAGISYVEEGKRHPLYQYDSKGNLLDKFNSAVEASTVLEIPRSSIAMNLCGKRKTCHGFVFKFVKDEKTKRRARNKFIGAGTDPGTTD